jgi:hypothetical protein
MTEPEPPQNQTPEEPETVATGSPTTASPEPPRTDEEVVDAAIDRLGALEELPVAEHVAVFDEAHRMLQDSLADLDED